MKDHPKNNYAYEIRFVDDKIVQVFDIAAKHQQEGNDLPIEYNQEEVLRGQLRYSKLLGSTPTSNKLGIEDDGTPYEHQVTTKRSNNRRSIQRHTFFMMGGGGGESRTDVNYYNNDTTSSGNHNTSSSYNINNNNDKQPQDFIEDLKPTVNTIREEEDNKKRQVVQQRQEQTSSPPSPTPSIILSSLPSPVISTISPPKPPPQAITSTSMRHSSHHVVMADTNNYQPSQVFPTASSNEEQPIPPATLYRQEPSFVPLKPQEPTIIPLQTQPQQKYQYYTEDYTSMTMIDTNDDCDSKKYMQRQESFNSRKGEKMLASPKRSCCIIS